MKRRMIAITRITGIQGKTYSWVTYDVVDSSSSVKLGTDRILNRKSFILAIYNAQTVIKLVFYH